MMKFFKSLFTREQTPPPEMKRPLLDELPREVRQAAGTDRFFDALDRDMRKRHYTELSRVAEGAPRSIPPAEQAAILRHMADRVEKTAERQAGIESARQRQTVRVMTGDRPGGIEQHKAAWIEKYRERAAQRQAAQTDQPKQTPRGPRIKF